MKPPNIGAALVKNFDNSADEALTWRRHLGWDLVDGTPRDLGYDDAAATGPYYFGPVPPNIARELDLGGNVRGDARWWWTLQEVSAGVQGDPPASRGPDRVVRLSTGLEYEVLRLLDVASSQSGLRGALLVPRADG